MNPIFFIWRDRVTKYSFASFAAAVIISYINTNVRRQTGDEL